MSKFHLRIAGAQDADIVCAKIEALCAFHDDQANWTLRFLNIAQYQMIENNGFHAHIRHRLAYGSQFWDPAPQRSTMMKLGPDPIII